MRLGRNALDVLIVDDSVAIRVILQRIIRNAGLDLGKVLEAGNGAEALDKLKGEPVDLILSDIGMPHMDGLELLSILKSSANLKHVPFIIVTTDGRESQVNEALRLGASGYVRKPFNVDQIKNVLETLF
jgi:two-component system chemotaxis response regulator CheY